MRAGSVPPFSNIPQAQAPPTIHTPTQQGVSPNNMYMMAGGDGVGQYENQSELQYGNPMSFLTPPSKMMGMFHFFVIINFNVLVYNYIYCACVRYEMKVFIRDLNGEYVDLLMIFYS